MLQLPDAPQFDKMVAHRGDQTVVTALPHKNLACLRLPEGIAVQAEGKFHQIKRMFEACGKKVVYMKSLSMGSLMLDPDLPEGEWRELTEQEIFSLQGERSAL